ncbi:hypothetical protein F5Y09DRAFT_341797 [Xylaria sp. FL1042]|nr:hypothetical protein F5Y09DRAFT_341797 [Xylaria sp. FL1042]
MLPESPNLAEAGTDVTRAEKFQFISIQGPDDPKDRATRRLARSHAVKQALKNKMKIQQESSDNFRVMIPQDKLGRFAKRRTPVRTIFMSPFSLSAGKLDPFETLAVDSPRLQTLLADYEARQSLEPVFNIAEQLSFQSFRTVFRTGLVDPALLSAIMYSLAFAVGRGDTNRECLGYQGRTFSYVRERMSSPSAAASEPTIGAILLLAGVGARLGMTAQVQLHLGAVRQLLNICQTEGVRLTGGIKRAIFWQDLNAYVLAGSSRIVDHTTFPELQWTRKSFSPSYFRLPPGFQVRSHLFAEEFIEILEDIHALQCHRDATPAYKCEVTMMESINNHTASIQSRLVALPILSPVMSCCHLAAYLCSVMMCCKVWCAPIIPPHVSSQLLRELQRADEDPVWNSHPELLMWLLYTGGAFAPIGIVRTGYVALLRLNNAFRFRNLFKSWPELLDILKQFIWSDKAFKSPVKTLWEETLA